ncbi:PREDICTED: jmjC domain-containing protein 8 [Galeopterus variegatus]|uniref:JmjC domain-containing protein 8 n=1 Tax=Galeopterus variegatus TaxID=482537 RepID=A0ABM0R9W7_GALVR|nr:PREDICTED: jmjC domain-containing protein 8 [Galeopterus variegatus]
MVTGGGLPEMALPGRVAEAHFRAVPAPAVASTTRRPALRGGWGGGLMALPLRALAVLAALAALSRPGSGDTGDGGWPGALAALAEEDRCTIERRSDLSYAEFVQHYAFLRPVILPGLTDNWKFRALCSRERLLASFGDSVVRLSTANTYSYQKVDLPFQEYVEQLLHPQDPSSLGNDTLYFFGDNNFTEWASLFRHYSPPPFGLLGTAPAYSFGIAGAGSGVPFHWHGPGYSEVIYGRKRWFLYPPEKTPQFHPNKTTLAWLQDTYPALAPSARPLECTIRPGEVLYFPDRWWHATLNLDTSVFISTFLG